MLHNVSATAVLYRYVIHKGATSKRLFSTARFYSNYIRFGAQFKHDVQFKTADITAYCDSEFEGWKQNTSSTVVDLLQAV